MSALNIGVIIGRFQVPTLHEGHLHLFKEVAAKSDRILVLLGVSPVDGYTAENPLTFAQRQSMIQRSVDRADVFHDDLTILPLLDQRDDDVWSAQVDTLVRGTFPGHNHTLYGGRKSFAESYKGALPVVQSAFCPVIPATGTQSRAAIKEENDPAFLRGQIAALNHQFPKVYPTVDMAVIRHDFGGLRVLFIQRADSGHCCFPGGFVDPTDRSEHGRSFEMAAVRELNEEVGITPDGGAAAMDYIGTFPINDFRYRGSRDKIITTFYQCNYMSGPIRTNPTEVQDYRWVALQSNEADELVSAAHRPLLSALQERRLNDGQSLISNTSIQLCGSGGIRD